MNVQCYIPLLDVYNDTITQIGATTYNPAISASDLVDGDPSTYSLQSNTDGETMLCVIKSDTAPLLLSGLQGGTNPFAAKAKDMHYCDYVGGHPIHRPGPRIP